MPFKKAKKDAAETLTLQWILQIKNFKLTLDKKRCVGCQICTLACPKEAIKTQKQPKNPGEKTKHAKIDIDQEKCNFCGICDITCPYGAIKLTLNGQNDLSILTKESYPTLTKDITINTKLCEKECTECETACPLALIKVTRTGYDGKPVQNTQTLTPSQKQRLQINLNIKTDQCPTCRLCEFKCSPGAIKVKKAIEGKITINQEKCPEGCKDCQDVCPITGTLVLGEDKKIHVNELYCTYCGACKNVCPENEALTLKRTSIHHSQIKSGTWNKALERLTSPADAAKERRTDADKNRIDAIQRRFVEEEITR